MRIIVLFFAVLSAVSAQVPSVSNIAVTNVSHASLHVTFDVSANSFVQIKYGLSSGSYPYASSSPSSFSNKAAMAVGGLRPGTTYYLRVTARPNADDNTDICQSDGCGAVEQVVTTLPEPPVHPAPPVSAEGWEPGEVDTTGYTVIPMQVSGIDGQCVASQNVAQQAGWSAAVSQGDAIPAILGKIFYGTVIEFPQGANCKVYESNPTFHNGYDLVAKGVDSVNPHRWIVFRTAVTSPVDFPLFGVRTGPAWAAKMAKFIMQSPGMPTGAQNFTGQVFQSYNENSHHYWFQNLEFTNSTAGYQPLQQDPEMFTCPIQVEPLTANPHHMVLDRLYIHSAAWPSRLRCGLVAGGDQFALLSSYVVADVWRIGLFPDAPVTASGDTITVPKDRWAFRATDTPYGMTAATTIQVAGTGTVSCWIDAATSVTNGLTCRYSGLTSATCGSCNIAAGAQTIPATAMRVLVATVSGGTATITETAYGTDTTTRYGPWQPLGIFVAGGNQKTFSNNYIQAIGQTVYNDALDQPSFLNHLFVRNFLDFPRSKMTASGQWDGYWYTFRNPFETKQADRWRIEGNIVSGAAAYQNAGWALMTVGSYPGTGTKNVLVRNNIFRHISAGYLCAGGGAIQPPDSPTARQIEISNNLWLDLNRDKYNNGGGSLMSGPFGINPGCEDVNITRNTVDLTLGPGPALLLMGAAGGGATVAGEGLNFTNNLAHVSLNALDPIWSQCGQLLPSHPANPAAACSGMGLTYRQLLDAAFIRTGPTVTPNYTFKRNVFIGGQTHRGRSDYTDMSSGMVNDEKALFPADNVWATGNNLTARRTVTKWDAKDFRTVSTPLNPGDVGANVEEIRVAAGIVQNVLVRAGATSAQFTYTAPDARGCSVETGLNGTAWTRVSDGGGGRTRTVNVTGLTAASTYQYRILCYFDQLAAQEFPADQLTSGSFPTLSGVAHTVWIAAPLAQIPQGASMRVTVTPIDGGTPIQATCTASPCAITAAPGLYEREVEILDSGNTQLSSDVAVLSVQ